MIDLSDFLYIESSSFMIGINTSEAGRIISALPSGKLKKEHVEASSPQREIDISPFYIAKKMITVSEFREFVAAASYVTESEKEGWGWVWENSWKKREGVSWKRPFGDAEDIIYTDNPDKFPVMQVSWNDAVTYTEWRSIKEGRSIRLPGEIEWEVFAGMAGIGSMSQLTGIRNPEIKNSTDFIQQLQKEINYSPFNIGLLWEWTLDWYNGYTNEVVAKDFGEVYKVLRGGSLLSEEIQKTKEFRFRRCPTARSPFYGFRIVLSDVIKL